MDNCLFLTNTDTTIGFLSKNRERLDRAKNRLPNKTYIQAIPSLKSIKKRVPKKFRRNVRVAKKSTFVLSKSYSFRVIKDKRHKLLINRLSWAYTTSANQSGKGFDYNFAYSKADIIIYPLSKPKTPSTIYKLGKIKQKRLR